MLQVSSFGSLHSSRMSLVATEDSALLQAMDNNGPGNCSDSNSIKMTSLPTPSNLTSGKRSCPSIIEGESKRQKIDNFAVTGMKRNADASGPVTVTSSDTSNASASNSSIQETSKNGSAAASARCSVPIPTSQKIPAQATAAPPPPAKAITMDHLRQKYMGELEYMLREFRKLERQLLGAKGAAQLEESAGSRERREKLHSFILHLEDTVQQIEDGCVMEKERKAGAAAPEGTKMEDEDNVKKLEEHILANLLPVKIRLKKQLAAQQGASRNPPGMPAPRRGSLQPTNLGKGTFAAAAEERRKQAEAARLAAEEKEHAAMRRVSDPTQFGKPLGGGGSSLTQKLHGATLGSKQRTHGHGVGSATALPAPVEASPAKILYAGMVPQSRQHQSSLDAASGVHELVVEDPKFTERISEVDEGEPSQPPTTDPAAPAPASTTAESTSTAAAGPPMQPSGQDETIKKSEEDISVSTDERKRMRKKRRKRKLLKLAKRREKERQRQIALQQQAQAAQGAPKAAPAAGRKKSAASKVQGKKKGPKSVEYMCALCSETYTSTCDYNPWWALAQHECPKCRKMQIPRIDISAPANAIEYHPALLAHADENNGGGSAADSAANDAVPVAPPQPALAPPPVKDQDVVDGLDSDSDSELSELSDASLSEESFSDDDDSLDFQSMTPAEQAEHETFGDEYRGPVLSEDDASRLLILMSHASTCPCRHKLTKHRDICKSTKFLMLHVRDCPGTTASFDVCPFPWCRKVKHLLYHLVSCSDPDSCNICSPKHLSESLKNLHGLNTHRLKKYRQRLVAAMRTSGTSISKGRSAPCGCSSASKPTKRRVAEVDRASQPKTEAPASPPPHVPVAEEARAKTPASSVPASVRMVEPSQKSEDSIPHGQKEGDRKRRFAKDTEGFSSDGRQTSAVDTESKPLLKSELVSELIQNDHPPAAPADQIIVNHSERHAVSFENKCVAKEECSEDVSTQKAFETSVATPASLPNGADTKLDNGHGDADVKDVAPLPCPLLKQDVDGIGGEAAATISPDDAREGETAPSCHQGLESREVAIKSEDGHDWTPPTEGNATPSDTSEAPSASESQFGAEKNPINGRMGSRTSSGVLKIVC